MRKKKIENKLPDGIKKSINNEGLDKSKWGITEPSQDNAKAFAELMDRLDEDDDLIIGLKEVDLNQDYPINYDTKSISFIEFAIINSYLFDCYKNKTKNAGVSVDSYGFINDAGRIIFGGGFSNTNASWFSGKFNDTDNDFIFQTKMHVNSRNELVTQLHITNKIGVAESEFEGIYKKLFKLAFNNSEYKGKVIKVKLNNNNFNGIEIIELDGDSELILNDTQNRFINHFITRVGRGGNARYLLNGAPGTGKTESIRNIARKLTPNVTFIIPDFSTADDLITILESCQIFDRCVIIMDDIDLYLGNRENGTYTRLLGQFLSFFDGVKKQNLSLLASTNDKGLVDAASSRPGRFSYLLDYDFLNEEQIIKVCQIHLPKIYQVKEVYDVLTNNINGKKTKITGAFISNLADNLKEMSEDDETFTMEDAISLIKSSYLGFYGVQTQQEKQTLGFKAS